jgi:Uma2 family endonuclease
MTTEKVTTETDPTVRGQPTVHADKPKKGIPPLQAGARLTRDEFERRYEAMPHLKKAELIQGVVYMPSPLRYNKHSRPHAHIVGWLFVYCAATPGIELGDNATVRLQGDNEPQPDAFLRINEALGGSSRIDDDDYIEGAPELIVEVAGSSADYDLGEKREVYQRHGVQEYVVWRTEDEAIDWFRLVDGAYFPVTPDADGVISSRVFPGLRLTVSALLDGNLAEVLAELHKGLETAEHTAFVERLAAKSEQ